MSQEVTLSGVLVDKTERTMRPVIFFGEASLAGGPVPPDPGRPPGIWGPTDPRPTPPIANVPGLPPTQNPPGWGLHPAHPIVDPPRPPIDPPVEPPTQPPDAAWDWCWSPAYGWHPAFVAGDKPHPPSQPSKK